MFLNLVYLATLFLATPFLLYRSLRQGKYRDGWSAKFLGLVPRLKPLADGRRRIWFHAVSVGEVNLLKPIVAELEATRPDWEFVVSATSKTGFELARQLYGARTSVFYCPLDFTWAAKTALRRLRPDALVLAELELWPNLIAAASKRGVRVAVVNGRIGDGSFR
ncbi:MAG: 3-deoxy-D-manno-octulosonic acid transferase, partial [Thermoguttaceae bacterium]|nr:3-deoxy-D-manno-octulosonic acid transferase [Thermoguttaceae bacterium]